MSLPEPKRALEDAIAAEARADGERADRTEAEPLPGPVRGLVDFSSWLASIGVTGAGLLVLFLIGWALEDGVDGGGAIGNMLLFLGLPVVVGTGVAAGRALRRTQERRLRASLDVPRLGAPDPARASAASESPVAVRPDRT